MIKSLLTFLFIAICLSANGQSTNRTPLNKPYLQSNMDGNSKAITNLNEIRAVSFIDAITGLPYSSGAAGSFTGNANQFGVSGGQTIIKSGSLQTNNGFYGTINFNGLQANGLAGTDGGKNLQTYGAGDNITISGGLVSVVSSPIVGGLSVSNSGVSPTISLIGNPGVGGNTVTLSPSASGLSIVSPPGTGVAARSYVASAVPGFIGDGAGISNTISFFTNGSVLYVDANGDDSKATRGVRDKPWKTITNAIANMQSGDTLRVLSQGVQVFTNAWRLPAYSRFDAGNFDLTNAIVRGTSDPADNTLWGPMLVPGNYCIVENVRFHGLPTVNTMQNSPCIGTIYFDKDSGGPCQAFTNVVFRNLYADNFTTELYIRHTNGCSWTMDGCTWLATKNPAFVSYGPHSSQTFDSIFIGDGPDTIYGDSIAGEASGYRIMSGTHRFYSCYFRGTNPTNNLSSDFATNACGISVQDGENGQHPAVYLNGCTLEAWNTNLVNPSPSYAILNGSQALGEASPIILSGCYFDRNAVFGPITEINLPIVGGLTNGMDTNQFLGILTGSGDNCVDTSTEPSKRYKLDSSFLPTIRFTNSCGYYMTGTAGNWSFFDEFDGLSMTNKFGGWFTNGFFTDANSALNTNNNVVIRYFKGAVTNTYIVWPYGAPISANGSAFTNINASELRSGTVATARLGSGTANGNTVLRGDSTWGTVPNAGLANSAITINGTSVSLGGTRTLTLASSDYANQGTATAVLHGNASGNPSFGSVVEGDQSLSDVTTANTSTSKHGYAPKLDNNSAHFLDGTGAWSTPAGAGGSGWGTTGNSGLSSANFVGTTDLVGLQLRVDNGIVGLFYPYNPATQYPNIVFGGGSTTETNTMSSNPNGNIIAGGHGHTMQQATAGGIFAGVQNTIQSNLSYSVILGGSSHLIRSNANTSAILAGNANDLGNGPLTAVQGAIILGGINNTNLGNYSVVVGGSNNKITGQRSWAGGLRAQALHDSTFVWSDSQNADFASPAQDTFNVRAQGGMLVTGKISGTGFTNTSLTASRMMLTDASKAETSASASGAVPINADGSATGIGTALTLSAGTLNGQGYTVPFAEIGNMSPSSSQTYYIGGDFNSGLQTTYANQPIQVIKAGTLKGFEVNIRVVTVLGTGENVQLFARINDTTDVGPLNTTMNAAYRATNITSLSQALVVGDQIALKWVTPAWSTSPQGVRISGYFYIE